jgi:hypothetical protein
VEAAHQVIARSASYNPKANWVNPSGSYDLWLRAQAQGRSFGDQFFWWYEVAQITR